MNNKKVIKKHLMKIHSLPVKREYLNKDNCRIEARRILKDELIDGMTEKQLAAEIYFHAVIYYFCERTGRFDWIKMKADPIDLCDGGDKLLRRAVFAAGWRLKRGK